MSTDTYQTCDGLAWRTVEENTFVYGSNGRLHILEGSVAAYLWAELDGGPMTVDDLVVKVVAHFAVTESTAKADGAEFLNGLIQDSLARSVG